MSWALGLTAFHGVTESLLLIDTSYYETANEGRAFIVLLLSHGHQPCELYRQSYHEDEEKTAPAARPGATPVILALERLRKEDRYEFLGSLSYMVRSRLPCTTETALS